jgi:2'-5' RNA ligase
MTQGPPREEQPRLFVAIELPEAWKQGLERLQVAMREALTKALGSGPEAPRLRWTRQDGIHLTLKFLGETPVSRLPAIEAALAAAVPAMPGFSLGLGRAGSFSDRRAPRVILATVTGETQALQLLAERIETRLASAGFPRERRAFQPHLTLGRLPDHLSTQMRQRIAEVTGAEPPPRVDAFRVERVCLVRSYIEPGGARYEQVAAFPAL